MPYAKTPEGRAKKKANRAAYYAAHREEARAYAREHPGSQSGDRHKRSKAERMAEWRASNPEKAKEASVRQAKTRRARIRGATVADLTRQQWVAILEAYNLSCAYCNEPLTKVTVDHVLPISKGGGHTATNVVPACPSCNLRKATKIIEGFQPRLVPA